MKILWSCDSATKAGIPSFRRGPILLSHAPARGVYASRSTLLDRASLHTDCYVAWIKPLFYSAKQTTAESIVTPDMAVADLGSDDRDVILALVTLVVWREKHGQGQTLESLRLLGY